MFGLKWLWKSNKTNIDTSNFVSKEFFSTTLQDYVNRDLFNTTLQSYITSTTLNNTLTNYVSTNTEQTITGLKTFRAAPIGFKLQQAAGRIDKQYITFNNSSDTTTFSLGSQLTETSFEANRGNIKFQTQEAGKKVIFDTPLVEFNNAVPQFGTEIKAGYGAGLVKFLPEDNSTKTLQFYLNNANDTRRFNLKVAEPTEANNPTTKNYVDTRYNSNLNLISGLRQTTNELEYKNVFIEQKVNTEIPEHRLYQFAGQSSTPTAYGEIFQYTLQISDLGENSIVGVNLNLNGQNNAPTKAYYWNTSYIVVDDRIMYIKIFIDKYIYNGYSDKSVINLDFSQLRVSVFFVPKYNTKTNEKIYQGEIVKLQEIKGGK